MIELPILCTFLKSFCCVVDDLYGDHDDYQYCVGESSLYQSHVHVNIDDDDQKDDYDNDDADDKVTNIVQESSRLELFTTGVSLNLMNIPVDRIVITRPDKLSVIMAIVRTK